MKHNIIFLIFLLSLTCINGHIITRYYNLKSDRKDSGWCADELHVVKCSRSKS